MVKIPEKAIIAAAEAMYKSKVEQAQKIIAATNFHINELPDIMKKISTESETAQVLIFSSYLESKIEELLGHQLRKDIGKTDYEDIFGTLGPLATFSGRTALAYQLRWLEKPTKKKLDTFRKLRNEFAHNAYKVSYKDDRIKSWFAMLEANLSDFIEKVGPIMREHSNVDIQNFSEISVSTKYLCWLAMLARDVCMELLVLPACVQIEVHPSDVTRTSTAPSVINDLVRAMIKAIYVLVGKNQETGTVQSNSV